MNTPEYYAFRKLDYKPNSAELLHTALEEAFKKITNKPIYWERDMGALEQIIVNGADPSQYFLPLAYGAFKEIYQLNQLSNYIVKFVSWDNPTKDECELAIAAKNHHVDNVFLNTLFVPFFGYTVPTPMLFKDLDYDPFIDAEPYAISLQIQPRVLITSRERQDSLSESEKYDLKKNFQYPDHIDLYIFHKIDDPQWLTDVIDYYGFDFLEKFSNFCEQYKVTDLHWDNIGWDAEGRPIIFDWMSRHYPQFY